MYIYRQKYHLLLNINHTFLKCLPIFFSLILLDLTYIDKKDFNFQVITVSQLSYGLSILMLFFQTSNNMRTKCPIRVVLNKKVKLLKYILGKIIDFTKNQQSSQMLTRELFKDAVANPVMDGISTTPVKMLIRKIL